MASTFSSPLADSLRFERRSKKLSALKLAAMTEISVSVIQNIESGRKKGLSVAELIAFSKALGVSPERIEPALAEVLSLEAQRRQIRSETYVEAIATLAEKAGQS